jgi:TRAP-type C4-dicarboxylate transport system permease small subunit
VSQQPGNAASASLARAAERFGRGLETTLLTVVLVAMVGLAAAQIALRNFGSISLPWADETLRLLVLWAAMLGAVAASREQRHVSIDALARWLPARLNRALRRFTHLFAAVVSAALAWFSYGFVAESLAAGDRALGGALPAWAVQSILPAGFALIAYRYAVLFVWPPPAVSPPPGAH